MAGFENQPRSTGKLPLKHSYEESDSYIEATSMSWWDSSSFSSFATNALKTAQSRIDKVLDIKDEDEGSSTGAVAAAAVAAPANEDKGASKSGDFWASYLGSDSLTGFTSAPSNSKSVSKPTARTPAPSKGSKTSPSNTSERSELKASATSAFTVRSKRVESTTTKNQFKEGSSTRENTDRRSPVSGKTQTNVCSISEQGNDDKVAPESLGSHLAIPQELVDKEVKQVEAKLENIEHGNKPITLSSDLPTKPEDSKKGGPLRLGSKLSKKKTEDNLKKTEQEKAIEEEQAIDAQVDKLLETEQKVTCQDQETDQTLKPENSASIDVQDRLSVGSVPAPVETKVCDEQKKEWSSALEPDTEMVQSVEGSGWEEEEELDIDDIIDDKEPSVASVEPREVEDVSEPVDNQDVTDSSNQTQVAQSLPAESSEGTELSKMEESSQSVEVIETSELWKNDEVKGKDVEGVGEQPTPMAEAADTGVSEKAADSELEHKEEASIESQSVILGDIQDGGEALTSEVSFDSSDTTEPVGDDQLSESSRTLTGDDFHTPQEEEQGQAKEQEESQAEDQKEESQTVSDSPDLKARSGSGETEQGRSSEEDKKTGSLVSSSYVKTMLEEAMTESVKDTDSHSSSTSDKSSEMVRIESGMNSGHTSGDEIDTTTSSDIEIISTPTPNGEYRQERPFDLSPLRHALSRTMRRGSPPGHKRSDSSSSAQSTWSKNGDDLLSPEGGAHRDPEAGHETRRDDNRMEHVKEGLNEKGDAEEKGSNNPLETQTLLKDKWSSEEASTSASHQPNIGQSLHTIVENVEPSESSLEARPILDGLKWVKAPPSDLQEKLAEMAEVLEAREKKLVELSRENIDLHETKAILKNQLQQSEEARESELEDLNTVTDEFTGRISDFEQRLQHMTKERDALKKQLTESQSDLTKKSSSSSSLEKLLKEKDQQVSELLDEGEKLSKQQLQSNNIIKKLRAKEKDNDAVLKAHKQKLDQQTEELNHLRMVLDAKEDLEKKQIEAIGQQNVAVKKQEAELSQLRLELEDMQEKSRGLQVALDNSYKEISELHKANAAAASETATAKLSVEMSAKQELQMAMERQTLTHKQQMEALVTQIEDMQLSMVRQEREQGRREDVLRQEISDVQQRLQEAEERNQDLTQSVTSATRPLLRQIENLQSTYTAQSGSYEKVERNLTDRLHEAQNALAEAAEKERSASERLMDVTSRLTSLETQVSTLRQEKSHLQAQLEVEKTKVLVLEDAKNSESAQLVILKTDFNKQISELKKEKLMLENQFEMEKMRVDAERKKLVIAHEQLRDKELQLQRQGMTPSPRSTSQDESLSGESSNAQMTVSVTQEDILEKTLLLGSANGNKSNLYETLRHTGAATLVENLQSQLKMKEGEIAQLQNEITELERTREAMARELVNLSTQNDTLQEQLLEYPELKKAHGELDSRYNALLQMYGEKVEEADELNMDLQDIKDMYKAQIEELLKRVR